MPIVPDMDSSVLHVIIQFYLHYPNGDFAACLPETHHLDPLINALCDKEERETSFDISDRAFGNYRCFT